jgi:putative transcriptional regulator
MRHVPIETLAEHASGQLDLALRVLIEAHLDLCAECRAEQAALVAPGGRLLVESAPTPPPAKLWARLEAELDAGAGRTPDALPESIPLPLAARRELPEIGPLRWWKLFLGGARMTELAVDPVSGAKLMIGQMPPGLRFPRHLHEGFEHVVVLSGGYDDERGQFVAGDYAVYEPGSEHGPDTLDGDSCWILFRLDGAVRFRGWRGLLQRLVP